MTRRTKAARSRLQSLTSNPQNSLAAESGGLSMGYAGQLNKETAQTAFHSSDFLQDAADYYYKRDGKSFGSTAEVQDYFMSDRRWRNMNTISIGKDLYDAHTSSDEQSARLARMQGLFDALPNFYEEGGDGWKGLGENALAAVADPINLVGFGAGGQAAKLAASRAIAAGSKAAIAKRAGLKAGIKTGAIGEGVASGLVEGVADQGIQRRNVEIGLQDEVSYLQTGAAMGIGAVVGGALGGVFGAAGAVNPLRKGGKSNITEGIYDGIGKRRKVVHDAVAQAKGMAADEAADGAAGAAPVRFSTQEKDSVAAQVDTRVQRMEADRVEAGEAFPQSPETAMESETPTNPVAATQRARDRMIGLHASAEYDRAASKKAYEGGDDTKGAEFDRTAAAKQQKSNDIQSALERIVRPEQETPSDRDLIDVLEEATRGAEELLQITFDPSTRTTTPVQRNLPDGSPVLAENTADPRRAARGDLTQEELNRRVRNDPKQDTQGFSGRSAEEEIAAQREEMVDAGVAVRESETEVAAIDKERNPLVEAKATLDQQLEDATLQAAAYNRGEGGTPVTTEELADLKARGDAAGAALVDVDARKEAADTKLKDAEDSRRNLSQTHERMAKEAAEKVEASAQGTPVSRAEGEDAADVVDNTEDYTPDNMAETIAPTTTNIVNLLEALGDDPKTIRRELKSLGDGRKPEVKAQRREFLRKRLEEVYARERMQGIVNLISTGEGNSNNIFHLELSRATILGEAETPEQGEMMVRMYNEYVGNRARKLFIEHLESTSADPLEAMEKLRGRYGDELVSILNERLGRGSVEMRLEDANQIRDLFKGLKGQTQEELREAEEAMISKILAKDPSFDTNTARAIVYEMTENSLRKAMSTASRTVQRSEAVINQEQSMINGAIGELRALRLEIMRLKSSVPARKRGSLSTEDDFALDAENLELILSGKADVIRYDFNASEKMSDAQKELIATVQRAREVTRRLGLGKVSIGQAMEVLATRSEKIEKLKGTNMLVDVPNGTRLSRSIDVADEYAGNAMHMGTQRRQGLGTYTSYGKQVKGGDVIKKAQGMARRANKFGFSEKLTEMGVKVGIDGRMHKVGIALNGVSQIFDAAIAAANNRLVRDPIKQERNAQELVPLQDMVADIKKAESKIKALTKKIDNTDDEDKLTKMEADLDAANIALSDLNTKAITMVDVSYRERAELPRQALQQRITELSQSTGVEAAGNRKEVFMADASVNLLKSELGALKKRMANIARRKDADDGSKMSDAEEQQIMKAVQRITAQLEKAGGPTEKGAEKALRMTMRDNIRVERAAEAQVRGEEIPKEDFVGVIPPEIKSKAHVVANETQRKASAEARFSARFREIAESDMSSFEKSEAVDVLRKEFSAHLAATKAPDTIPEGKKHKPHIVVVDGIEVDVHNDFTFTKQGNRTQVGFDGETVGTIDVLPSGEVLLTKAGGDELLNARKFSSKSELRDKLPELIRERIGRKQEATQMFEERPDEKGMSYAEPDWTKSETYKEETPTPATQVADPIEDPIIKSDPNNPLSRTVDDYDLPPGRDIAVQIVDPDAGKAYGQVRVFSRKTKQSIGDVLKASAKFQYVVGHVQTGTGSKSFNAQETFRPFDAQEEFVPAYSAEKVTVEKFDPRLATQSSKVRSKRPTSVEKAAAIPVDAETLSFTPHTGDNITNVAELAQYANSLDNIKWRDMSTLDEYRMYFELRQRVSTELQTRLPNGLRLPSHTMRQSMTNLTSIMDNLSPSETQASVDFMMRIARLNGGKAPIFSQGADGVPPNFSTGQNSINLSRGGDEGLDGRSLGRFDESTLPQTMIVTHEMGHWIYFNMLDEADKLEFWGGMQKYYDVDGQFSADDLKRRGDIFGDGGATSNSLENPAEFFANQFVLWASRSGMVPNLSLWDKVAKIGAKLLDMITGKNQLELDGDLVQLFQRKLPVLGVDPVTGVSNNGVSAFAHLKDFGKQYGKDGGKKAYVFGKAMEDLDVMRADLQTAMATSMYNASDATTLAETMQTAGRRLYGMIGGKTNTTHHPDYGKSKTSIDVDGNSRLVEQGNSRLKVLDQMNAYNRLAKAQFAVHDFIKELREAGAMRETKDGIIGSLDLNEAQAASIEETISRQYGELESGGSFDAQMQALEAIRERTPFRGLETSAIMHLHRLNQEMMLAMDDMIRDVSRAYTRQIPRSGKEFVTVSIQEGVNKGRMFQSRNKRTRVHQKKAADAEAQRQEDYWDMKGFVQKVNAERIQRLQGEADPAILESPKSLDTDALAREGMELPEGSKRRADIANEMKDRTNAVPKTKAEITDSISDTERQIMEAIVDEESARKVLNTALGMQSQPNTGTMAARIIEFASKKLHDMGVENPLPVTNPKVSAAIEKVADNKAGVDDDIGIDAGTPESIKVYARQVTNRDGRASYVGRQAFQRLSILLGEDNAFGEYQSNVLLARSPEEFGDDELTPIPTDSEMFISVIKRMRKISNAAGSDPQEANRMVAESVYQMLAPSEQKTIMEFAALNEVAPQVFYAEQVNKLLAQGKVFAEEGAGATPASRKMIRQLQQGAEQVAFVLNGLSDSEGQVMKMAYGDMFAPTRMKSPHMNAADAVNRNAVSPVVAGKYAQEVVRGMTGRVETAAREFLGITPAEPMGRYVMFNRAENSEVNGVTVSQDGTYGTGIYLKEPGRVESDYNPDTFQAEMNAKINESGLTGEAREAALDSAKLITGLRERIKTASNGAKSKSHIRDLLYMEDLQWKVLRSLAPLIPDNKVSPVLVRISNTFDMTGKGDYTITGDTSNSIGHLLSDMAGVGLVDERGVRRLIQTLPQNFTGRDFHSALTHPEVGVMHLDGNSTDSTDAINKLNEFLLDYGYDSINTDDGMVVFGEGNVRHVKHGFTESEAVGHLPELHGGDTKTTGNIVMEMYYRNEPLGKGFAPGVAKELERSGTAPSVSQLALKIMKNQELDPTDVEKASMFSSVRNFFTENSRLFRSQGAKWFGDTLKPVNGVGLFERHDVELNNIVSPIYKELNKLPGSKTGFSRWARKNVEFINAIGQPASHKRVMDALRLGRAAVERLDPQERTVAMKIASAFEAELVRLREMGMPVGDARRYGNDFYVPQVWDSEVILANPQKFRDGLRNFFLREQRRPDFEGEVKDGNQIDNLVESLFGRMTGEGGILDGTDVLTKALSDPMATRMLRLSGSDYPELSEFLVNDLSGILAKYFDRTVRKRQLSAKFGLQGHGFDTYKTIIQSGPDSAAEILMSNQNLVMHRGTLKGKAQTENLIVPRLSIDRDAAMDLIRRVKSKLAEDEVSGKQKARDILLNAAEISTRDFPQYRVRVDAIVNALSDFPQGNAPRRLVSQMENMNNVLNKRPIDGSSGAELQHKFTRNMKAFNSVSLLGFTTLTSLPDIALPLIRSGNMRAFATAWSKYATDPNYRAAAKNIGVGIENLLHDRMVQMGGEGSQKFTNAFFNFTLLTPWTSMQREVAAMVGFEAMKTEINRAVSMRMNGKKDSRGYRKAVRFLERYGLTGENSQHDFLAPGSYMLDDLPDNELVQNQVKAAMLRFTNEAIFTPNPNDIPMWAQTPWGSMMFQLKSFPLMMSRLSLDVMNEARHGNLKPLTYMATAGVGLGMLSIGVKDIAQSRGGEDQKSAEFRERALSNMLPVEEGGDYDERLGWYMEGLMAMGGLGLFAELLYNTTAQLDNGKYGYVRTMSYVFGPSVGVTEAAFDVAAGVGEAVAGDDEKNSKMRQGIRTVASRIPVLGGRKDFREGGADLAGEARKGGGKAKGFGQGFGGSFGNGKFGS